MPYLWSNPEDDKLTSANAPMPHLQAGDIGSIVAAIMRSREQASGRDRQDFNSMLSGIGKGVSGVAGAYEQNQQQGSYDDAANRAIYMSQNPGSMQQLGQMGADQFDQTYVPDYGGTSGYKAYQAAQDQESRDLKDAMTKARLAQIQQKLMGSGGSDNVGGGNDLSDDAIRRSEFPSTSPTWFDDQGREWRNGPGGRPIPVKSASTGTSDSFTSHQQMELDRRVNQLKDQSAKEEAANTAALKSGVHFSKENELNALTGYQSTLKGQAKGDTGSLKQEAMDAIARGADPAAVKARYKELTGQDL